MLVILPCSTNINYNSKCVSNGKKRIDEYVNGLKKFFSYDLSKFDIIFSDNTTLNLNDEIKKIIPSNVKIYLHNNNVYGCKNKGCGLIEHWTYLKNTIEKYEWIIHFEPRQILENNNFIESFLKYPRNLFCDRNNKHFQTGLFCIRSKLLLSYIKNVNLVKMVKQKISIEYDLYNWIHKNKIKYDIEHNLNVLWIDTYANKIIKN